MFFEICNIFLDRLMKLFFLSDHLSKTTILFCDGFAKFGICFRDFSLNQICDSFIRSLTEIPDFFPQSTEKKLRYYFAQSFDKILIFLRDCLPKFINFCSVFWRIFFFCDRILIFATFFCDWFTKKFCLFPRSVAKFS